MHRMTQLARMVDRYTLWAFNPQPPLAYRPRA